METSEAIRKRKSTRAFLDQEVSKETVKELLGLAKQAPSWVNSQPEHVCAVSGEKLTELRKAYLKQVKRAKKD